MTDERQPRQAFTLRGAFRVYFNYHQAAPLVWCVANDHIEIAVEQIAIYVPATTVYAPGAAEGKPSAWLRVIGVLEVDGPIVRIVPDREKP